jgi:hypothetical protein
MGKRKEERLTIPASQRAKRAWLLEDVSKRKYPMQRNLLAFCLLAFFALSAAEFLRAQEISQAEPSGEFLPPNENGFGAMLLFTEDLEFPKRFYKGGGELVLNATTNLKVGVPFLILVNFFGPGLTASGETKTSMDLQILNPDGTTYTDKKNLQVWKGEYPFSATSLQLADSIVRMTIEPHYQIGTYDVKVTIRDEVKDVALSLSKSFTVTK